MFTANFEQSNKADFIIDIGATDIDTGDDIDFTGASVSVVIRDENGCTKLTASTANGKVTMPSPIVVEAHFTPADMACLCPATYDIGAVYNLNGQTVQLMISSVAIYDGIASI